MWHPECIVNWCAQADNYPAGLTRAFRAGETSWDNQRWLYGGLGVFNMVLFGDFDFALFRASPLAMVGRVSVY